MRITQKDPGLQYINASIERAMACFLTGLHRIGLHHAAVQPGKKKNGLLSHLYRKAIFLPRQARDKHRENSKKDRLLAGGEEAQLSAAQLRLLEEVGCVRNTHLFCDAIVYSN